jgi:hypothetical protein
MRPKPVDEPEMNIRAMLILLDEMGVGGMDTVGSKDKMFSVRIGV